MDINDGIWETIKYAWQAALGVLSAVVSYMIYHRKKADEKLENRLEELENADVNHTIMFARINEKLVNIEERQKETAHDVKKVLFKL